MTQDSGQFVDEGRPDAILINGKGNMHDCSQTKARAGAVLRACISLNGCPPCNSVAALAA